MKKPLVVELVIVLLIAGALITIALPAFLTPENDAASSGSELPLVPILSGQRSAADDMEARSNLRNALAVEKAYFAVNRRYSADASPAGALAALDPHLFGTGVDPVTVTTGTGHQTVCLAQLSDSGIWFAIWDATWEGAVYYSGPVDPNLATCPDTQPSGSWSPDGF